MAIRMSQQTLFNEEDEFVKSLHLTDEKIIADLKSMENIDGFPNGDIEDILEISEPPYFTAYPNPYLKDYITYFGIPYDEETDNYDIEPFVGDISEGKNDPIYRAHSYHTKVPPKAIKKFIEHYTKPNDIVFDGFSGSGMTGIAAQELSRKAILSDLSPASYFISFNYNKLNKKNLMNIFNIWKKNIEKYYITYDENHNKVPINYIVWSDVFECPFCNQELIFWDISLNEEKTKVLKSFQCPHCDAKLTKTKLNRVFMNRYDNILKRDIDIAKQVPVRIYYKSNNKSCYKRPDSNDMELLNQIESKDIPYWFPLNEFPNGSETNRAKKTHGHFFVFQYYTKRSLYCLSYLYDHINKIENYEERMFLKWIFTSINPRLASKLATYRVGKGKSNAMSGVLYTPSFQAEYNIITAFESKLKSLSKLELQKDKIIQSTQSSINLSNIPSNSIDYIFIDPPFGSNLMYSELNYIWESWLKVFTNNKTEAIINKYNDKDSETYKELLINCFSEFHRILKPNRWITIEFHNSKAEIWNIIRESITKGGFVIAQVAILDKKQGTFKQINSPGSVKNDLIISAYKPNSLFSTAFNQFNGINLEIEFLELHLNKLPLEQNIERTEQMLYSKYLAQYLQNGFDVRLDSKDFGKLLKNNFVERDGFWFTSIQALKYDNKKLTNNMLKGFYLNQSILGISDEKTALIWLTHFLIQPRNYDEIYSEYVKQIMESNDKIPELKEILSDNFVYNDGKYHIPTEIQKIQIEKLKIKKLEKDFNNLLEEISESKTKVKLIRKEALLYGLTKLYHEKEIDKIIYIGKKIDDEIISSDDDISAIINWAKYK